MTKVYVQTLVDDFGDLIGKQCTSCKELKLFDRFSKSKNSKYNTKARCKSCLNVEAVSYREVNKDTIKNKHKEWRLRNKDYICEKSKQYYENNTESIKSKRSKYYYDNKDLINKKRLQKANTKRHYCDVYRTKEVIKNSIRRTIRKKHMNRKNNVTEIIGCSYEYLWNHLCGTFEENYGIPREWLSSFDYHIDHIIPLDSAKTVEDVYCLNHFTNLQILLATDNISKSNKLHWELPDNY